MDLLLRVAITKMAKIPLAITPMCLSFLTVQKCYSYETTMQTVSNVKVVANAGRLKILVALAIENPVIPTTQAN